MNIARMFQVLDGYRRRLGILILGRPTYQPYFKFLQRDHKLPPDPRALQRAGLKGWLVGFVLWLCASTTLQCWFHSQVSADWMWGSPLLPGSGVVWSIQLLAHTYSTPLLAAYIMHEVELAWTLEIAICICCFLVMFYVYICNSKDRFGLSMEHGSGRYGVPEEFIEMMPRNYDIWEGFNQDEILRRAHDIALFDEREARIKEYSKNYMAYERALAQGNHGQLTPEQWEDFFPLDSAAITEQVTSALAVDPDLLEPIPSSDVTPVNQSQIKPGTPVYRVDPALLDEPQPADAR
jgi:hypothetical protein